MPIQTPDRFMQANNIVSIGVAKTGVTIVPIREPGQVPSADRPGIPDALTCLRTVNAYSANATE